MVPSVSAGPAPHANTHRFQGRNHGDHRCHPRRDRHRRTGKAGGPRDRDNISIWLTILCGIGGVLIGWFIYAAFGGNGSPGIDWVRWIVAIAVAAVLVVVASGLAARSRTRAL